MAIATRKGIISTLSTIILFSVIAKAEPAQYIALTGGTNGFGAKYSYLIGPMSFDFGFPILYLFGREKWSDTTETKNEFHCNPYLSANLRVSKMARASFSVGIACVGNLGFVRSTYTVNDSVKENYSNDFGNDFGIDLSFGPIFEYTQNGKNNNRLFGAQLFPITFQRGYKNGYSIKIGVQLNYYIKRIAQEENTEPNIQPEIRN
jgi:hypothetical protein